MAKKILIYRDGSTLKPTGGPSGYLYSLRQGLSLFHHDNLIIDFLPGGGQSSITQIAKANNKKWVLKKCIEIYRRLRHIRTCLRLIYKQKCLPIDISHYDAIHFHTTSDMYEVRDELKKYKGAIILTSHSPQPLSSEIYEGSSKLELFFLKKTYKKMISFDRYAFEKANYVVFPCKTADEPYIHAWPEYSEIKMNKDKNAYRYFLSGTVAAVPRLSRTEVRSKYGLPEDAFVISYIGRHNEIKGYDKLISIGTELIKKHKNLYVLVAGKVGPLLPPNCERWIEVGWTNDPHSIVAASDTFVLPNKETYFDLVLLEVLSLGTPLVISNTGGNKYFEQFKMDGVKLYDTEKEAVEIIERNMTLEPETISKIMKENTMLYNSNFTIEKFGRNYVDLINNITSVH